MDKSSENLRTDKEMIFDYKKADKKLFNDNCLREYKYYPPILPKQERIVAIGDLHGDFGLAIKVLKIAKVIDDKYNWIGGNTVVVQVGDQLDNCRPIPGKSCNDPESDTVSIFSGEDTPEDIKVLEFFTKLSLKAEEKGGKVISLLGNHELLNVMGNMNYVSYNDIEKFKKYSNNTKFNNAKDARIDAFKPGNKYAKEMACSRLPAVIIGSYIFVHAGFINQFMDKINIKSQDDLYRVSYIMRQWLLNIIDKDNVVNILTADPTSMFWDRILGSIPANMSNEHPACKKYLTKVLEVLDADSIVIGHTPQFTSNEGINSTCDAKLWRIDFGGSYGFNKFDIEYNKKGNILKLRNAQVLEILNDKSINILRE